MWLPLMRPQLGTWHVTQARALTGNPLVHRLALNPLGHTSQGSMLYSLQVRRPLLLQDDSRPRLPLCLRPRSGCAL